MAEFGEEYLWICKTFFYLKFMGIQEKPNKETNKFWIQIL